MVTTFTAELFILTLPSLLSGGSHWSYTRPETGAKNWPFLFSDACAGYRQSPINLDSWNALYLDEGEQVELRIKRNAEIQEPEKLQAWNNGHSLIIMVPEDLWEVSLLRDAEVTHKVAQLHFHWGRESAFGSEHSIDRKFFPLEMHIVTRSIAYPDLHSAMVSPDGLAVIGVLFELTSDHSMSHLSRFGNFLDQIWDIHQAVSVTEIDYFEPDILLPENAKHYFRYDGSLTTPPCTENVKWTVLRKRNFVTEEDLNILRSALFGENDGYSYMEDNFRPRLPLNPTGTFEKRKLYKI